MRNLLKIFAAVLSAALILTSSACSAFHIDVPAVFDRTEAGTAAETGKDSASSENPETLQETSSADDFSEETPTESRTTLTVCTLDVGQGSCAICYSGDAVALLDCGGDEDHTQNLTAYLRAQNVQKIDYLIISHFDQDHIRQLPAVLKNFEVGTLLLPAYEADTRTYETAVRYIAECGAQCQEPKAGEAFQFGFCSITVVGPEHFEHEEENDNSLSVLISDSTYAYLNCGDAEEETETWIAQNMNIKADVLAVNHHGSSSSSTEEFLKKAGAKFAVISVGKDNEYGHPSEWALRRLKDSGILYLYRTDEQGDIIFSFTTEGIRFEQKPAENWNTIKAENSKGVYYYEDYRNERKAPGFSHGDISDRKQSASG